jgi:hypothetical protein
MSNEILPFCPTDTGSNLLTESDYLAATDRVSGNKPGVASAKLNNKALRQSTFVASQLAQFVSNSTATDVLDDAVSVKLLSQITSALTAYPPIITKYLSGSGAHNLSYIFRIASGSATIGATYTNNVFYAVRQPIYLKVQAIGGGGGGGGGGSATVVGADGGDTTFGTTLIVASGGKGAQLFTGGDGGAASLGTGPVGQAVAGGSGGGNSSTGVSANLPGGQGGNGIFGGGGGAGAGDTASTGLDAATNSGGGGGGAGDNSAGKSGGGGGAGGGVHAVVLSPSGSYNYSVGTGGAAGTGTTASGGAGAAGVIIVEEFYQ